MTGIMDLINEHCPDGVPYLAIGDARVSRQVVAGATPTTGVPAYWANGTIPWMSSGEVNKGTVTDTDKKITQAAYDSCSTKILPAGTVVIALAGQGKTRGLVARTRIELCTNQSLAGVVVGDAVSSDFLFYFLQTQYQDLRELSSGDGSRGGLNLQIVRAYRVPIPPMPVQEEIVRVLDSFQALDAALRAELAARQQQFAYYRDQLMAFRGASGVEWTPMGEVGRFTRGRRFTKDDNVEVGIPSIHYGEIYTKYGTATATTVSRVRRELSGRLRFAEPDDVVIATVGETVEDVAKAVAWLGNEPVAIHDDTLAFHSGMNPRFVSYAMQTAAFRAQKNQHVARAKVKRIGAEGLAKILIPVPLSIDEQDRVVSVLEAFDVLVNDPSVGLPAEIKARRAQFEYYRDKLLTFDEAAA